MEMIFGRFEESVNIQYWTHMHYDINTKNKNLTATEYKFQPEVHPHNVPCLQIFVWNYNEYLEQIGT